MSIASAIVLFLVIWFMTFLIVLPIRIETQGDVGKIVPGTHAGSPEHHHLRKKAWIVTAITLVVWTVVASIIFSGAVTVRDIDIFNRMSSTTETE